MLMQDNIYEVYQMLQKADNRKRKELEDKIKQYDLNLFAMTKDKSEPDKEFRAVYFKRCELLSEYHWKYGRGPSIDFMTNWMRLVRLT